MNPINIIAERYVKLSLNIGQHSPYYVDAYYGPEEWQPTDAKTSLVQLKIEAESLINDCKAVSPESGQKDRLQALAIHLTASLAYINSLNGDVLNFADECLALYDVVLPMYNLDHFDQALNELSLLVPGAGDLNQRFNDYRSQFVIAKDKLSLVFDKAISEARKRSLHHLSLPENESFHVELVKDQVWTAYNWYKGNSYSLIQLNTDLPIYIERAIDLAAHEGYPGHHVFNAQMEKHLVKKQGWMEYSIYNLYGPTSLLAEGSANYGIEIVFPWAERLKFERQVLFPIAGIDAEKSELYYQIQAILHKLSYVDNMVAQKYLDKEIDELDAIKLLMKYSLSSEKKARQRLEFIKHNRAYVITYNYGQDLVKEYLAKEVNNDSHSELWRVFAELLANPITASMMQAKLAE